jgi:hypothetical protein
MPEDEVLALEKIRKITEILFPAGIPLSSQLKLVELLPGLLDLVKLSSDTPEESPLKMQLRVLPVYSTPPPLSPPILKHQVVEALENLGPSLAGLAEREANA